LRPVQPLPVRSTADPGVAASAPDKSLPIGRGAGLLTLAYPNTTSLAIHPDMDDPANQAPAPPFRIRDATAEDLDAIINIDRQTSGAEKSQYWRDTFETYRAKPDGAFFLVAEWESEVIGFIAGEIRAWEFGSPPCGWVFAIGVIGDYRLQGTGSALLDGICERFRKAGVTHVRTMVAPHRRDVLAFFRSQGMMAGPYVELEKELTD
jgi:ribosomal protein S18 acetylase RimI-like enzyme